MKIIKFNEFEHFSEFINEIKHFFSKIKSLQLVIKDHQDNFLNLIYDLFFFSIYENKLWNKLKFNIKKSENEYNYLSNLISKYRIIIFSNKQKIFY